MQRRATRSGEFRSAVLFQTRPLSEVALLYMATVLVLAAAHASPRLPLCCCCCCVLACCAVLCCAAGNLVKVLLHTKVTKYLEFKSVTGSFVAKGGKPYKVPATASEAIQSPLMGIFQKRKFKNFVEFVNEFDEKTPSTHKGVNPNQTKTKEVYGQCTTQHQHA